MADNNKPSPSKSDLKESQAIAAAALKQARDNHSKRKINDRLNFLLGQFFADHTARNPNLRAYVKKYALNFHKSERDREFLRTWLDQIDEKKPPK